MKTSRATRRHASGREAKGRPGTPAGGPAFLTRFVDAIPWGGGADEFDALDNTEALAGFVVLDNWTRNCDRHCIRAGQQRRNLDNVLFTSENARQGKFRALAIDHGCAFVCGHPLRKHALKIAAVKDETLYGLFEPFRPVVTAADTRRFVARLREFDKHVARECVQLIPSGWGCPSETLSALAEFCVDRASFVAEVIERWLEGPCGWHTSLALGAAQ